MPLGPAFIMPIHCGEGRRRRGGVKVLTQKYFATYVWLASRGLVIGDLRHFDMYTPCRGEEVRPPTLPYAAMRCTDLHIKKKKKRTERDPLSDDHRDKMCLYSAFSRRRRRMKLFPLSDGRAKKKKKRILCEIDGFSSKWR